MTPAEATRIVENHTVIYQYGLRYYCPGCDGLRSREGCDAHRAATAYLASVAVVGATVRFLDAREALVDYRGGTDEVYLDQLDREQREAEQALRAALADVAGEVTGLDAVLHAGARRGPLYGHPPRDPSSGESS